MWDSIKIFSATKARDRSELGDIATTWIKENHPEIIDFKVLQSSDQQFHCLSIVIFFKKTK